MSNSAFLILDLQNDICSIDGTFHKNGLDANLSLKIVPHIVDMIYFCKKENIPVIEIRKNSITIIRIAMREYRGKSFVDIRQFYENDSGEYKPTQKGITLSPEKLSELIEALHKIKKQ